MKKIALVTIIVFIALLAGSYYYFSGKEYVVRLSESDMQSKLEAKLPLTKTYLFIIQVTLKNPRVHLENGSSRVDAGLDVVFNININKSSKSLAGILDVSGKVVYLAEKGQFFLTEPIVEHLTIQGIPPKYTDKTNKALTKALAAYYKNHPIYTLRVTDTKQVLAKMVLKNVSIENQELVVILGI
ncbi:MAG: DUF1439 domain-containing protein [Methylococcales bacterium]|nr:DUF1439 domain-containing protein [Methylococcales bacterium]MDQ7091900.1 DUF1439 domain-containing protein [Methylococcales bacterium]